MNRSLFTFGVTLLAVLPALGRERIRLPNHPALSPDGKTLAFDWNGDIWSVPIEGGTARPLTAHPASDHTPRFSPDGKEIAFISEREGSPQLFVMPASGGAPTQITFHSAGYSLYEWMPDGKGWLVGAQRDRGWSRRNNDRLQIVHRWTDASKRLADELVFDDYAQNGTLSPEGSVVLFNREGPEWWRKGYVGSQSAQIWAFNRDSKAFSRIDTGSFDSRWPMFGSKKKVYYACSQGGCFNIWEHDLDNKQNRQLTHFRDDATVFPCISRNGATIVFRHLFDLYRIKPGSDEKPVKIDIFRDDDRPVERIDRRVLTLASAASFTADGLEIAMVVGGDVWVMDTELREPRRVTHTPEEERQPIFSPDGKVLYFVSDAGGKPEIWRASRVGDQPWFRTESFKLERLTDDGEEKSRLSFSPDGSKLSYVRGRGDLYVADADGKNPRRIIESWNDPQYDWSPDGKWLVYALYDSDFNRDIWIQPLDGSREPFNLSRHPYNESGPVWSPDGKLIAFVGDRDLRGDSRESDIHYVWLRAEDDEKSSRDRTLEKALEKLRNGKGPAKKSFGPKSSDDGRDQPMGDPAANRKSAGPSSRRASASVPVKIDFEGIHDRIHRISIPNSSDAQFDLVARFREAGI